MFKLPAYWLACRRARAKMDVVTERVHYGPHPRQYAVVVRNRSAAAEEGPLRYAFYFHGGAWTFGRPETFVPAAIPWLERGFTVVLPSYRRPPRVGLHRIVADCRAAIAHCRPDAPVAELHVAGMSAGAHLAALLGSQGGWWEAAGWELLPSAVLCCAGPLSFRHLTGRRLFLPRYTDLDPINVLEPARAQQPQRWLLIHGTADRVVPLAHSQAFLAKLQSLGYPAGLEVLPGGDHLDSGRWMFGGLCSDRVRAFLAGD